MDGRDLDCRFETDGEFVVAGGHGPVLLEAADSALDRMPGLVVRQLAFSLQKLSQNAGGGLAVHGERRSHSSYCWSGRDSFAARSADPSRRRDAGLPVLARA